MFTLAISCLTTSSLPWFMDLKFQVPMQYCSLQHWTSITSHIHNWMLFSLCLCLFITSRVFPHSSSVACWRPTDLGSSSSIVISFGLSYCLEGSQGRSTEMIAIPFSSGLRFVRTLHQDPSIWVALHSMAHSFIELDKAVVHVISLVRFLWMWFSSVCTLMDKRLLKASWWGRDCLWGNLDP